MNDVDDKFYERADAHIHLSNEQITEEAGRGKVSASTMYSTATQKLTKIKKTPIFINPKFA